MSTKELSKDKPEDAASEGHRNKCAESNMEYKNLAFEVKALSDQEDPDYFYFEGLAAVFNNIDDTGDVIEPGAFTNSLVSQDVLICYQHKLDEPIGVPVELKETPEGLYVRAKLPKADTLVSGRVIPQISVGSIKTMSIGYTVEEFSITSNNIRQIEKLKLYEISIVSIPANKLAKITDFKSKDNKEVLTIESFDNMEVKELSEFLSGLGVFSKATTTAITSACINHKSLGKPSKDGLGKPVNDMSELIANINEFTKELDK